MSKPLQPRATTGKGYRFGRYLLVKPLGQGGMAQVWLARKQIHAGEKVCAIKMPADLLGLDHANHEALLNEIRISSQFSHSNIVQVFDSGVHRGVLYMELERIDGIDLDQLLDVMRQRQAPMSVGMAVYVWRCVLEALHYAYNYEKAGRHLPVIHRDLNPSNVLVSASGEVKVMDFGIAKMLDSETSGDHIKGKPRYMPPEQVEGRTSTKVDLFGAAAMFWEMVEGKQFRHEVPRTEMIARVLSGVVPPLSHPDIDAALRRVYTLCTDPDPDKRPANPAEVLGMLRMWPGRPAEPQDLRELYAWQLNARRHSGYTEADTEIPAKMFKLVEILRAIDAQQDVDEDDSAQHQEQPIEVHSAASAEPDVPAFFRRRRRSSNLAPTEDAPIPARAEARPVEPAAELKPPSLQGKGGTDQLVPRVAAPCEPTELLAAPQSNDSEPMPRVELRPTAARAEPTAVVVDGRSRRRVIVASIAAVLAVVLVVIVVATWPGAESPAATESPRPTAPAQAHAREPEPPRSGPVLLPVTQPAPTELAPPVVAGPTTTAMPAAVQPSASSDAAPADTDTGTAAPPAPRSAPTKPKSKPAPEVEVRLAPHFAEGELKIGKRVWTIAKTIDVTLRAGVHSMAWRPLGETQWRKVEPLRLSADRLYLVRVGATGPRVSSSPKGETP